MPFETPADRQEHYDKHEREFQAGMTVEEYETRAEEFMNQVMTVLLVECTRRRDGYRARLNLVTDEFGVVDSSGNIATYFIANTAIHGKPSNLEYHREWCR